MFDRWHPSFCPAADNLKRFCAECEMITPEQDIEVIGFLKIFLFQLVCCFSMLVLLFPAEIILYSLLLYIWPFISFICLISFFNTIIVFFEGAFVFNPFPIYLCLLSTGWPPRPRHSHPSLFGALWEHSHDHMAGHRLCLQGTTNGEMREHKIYTHTQS